MHDLIHVLVRRSRVRPWYDVLISSICICIFICICMCMCICICICSTADLDCGIWKKVAC